MAEFHSVYFMESIQIYLGWLGNCDCSSFDFLSWQSELYTFFFFGGEGEGRGEERKFGIVFLG